MWGRCRSDRSDRPGRRPRRCCPQRVHGRVGTLNQVPGQGQEVVAVQVDEQGQAGHFKIKDVAVKKGSGTASLGLDRYFVLIDGPTDDPGDAIVLELKQTRQSALHGLVPNPNTTTRF